MHKYLSLLLVSIVYIYTCKNNSSIYVSNNQVAIAKDSMYELKNNLLYQNKDGSIFLKRETHLIQRENSINTAQARYFDTGAYYDSVIKLSSIIHIESFKQWHKSDTFIDQKHIYIYSDHPAIFPQIQIYDKIESSKNNK